MKLAEKPGCSALKVLDDETFFYFFSLFSILTGDRKVQQKKWSKEPKGKKGVEKKAKQYKEKHGKHR